MAVCGIGLKKLRKIIGVGLILQIIVFSMYMTMFYGDHDIQTFRTIRSAVPISTTEMKQLTTSQNRSSQMDGGGANVQAPGGGANVQAPGGSLTVTSSCSGLVFPRDVLRRHVWQSISALKTGYVFSAYYDKNTLKILGVSSSKLGPVTCQLWYPGNSTTEIEMLHVGATVTGLPESHGKRFTAAYFTCNIPKDRTTVPTAVSIVKEKCSVPDNALPVTITKDRSNKWKFTVCLTPFNFQYGRAYELVEWIELNKILGADHFVFYNYSIASNVETVLQSYIKQGLIEVVEWKLPMGVAKWPPTKDKEEIHYFGQLASLNECLLRSRGKTEYLLNLDLDEFIIPRKKGVTTWQQMLASQPSSSGYLVANVFFRKEWNTSASNFSRYEVATRYRLVTLLKLQHESTVFNFKTRSKYIVKPFSVEVLGIHNIWRLSGKLTNIPHDVGLLHHYRNWLKYSDKQTRIYDDTVVQKYKDALLDNVVKQWDNLPGVELDIPLCDKPKDFGAC